jgi:hypothetical protein
MNNNKPPKNKSGKVIELKNNTGKKSTYNPYDYAGGDDRFSLIVGLRGIGLLYLTRLSDSKDKQEDLPPFSGQTLLLNKGLIMKVERQGSLHESMKNILVRPELVCRTYVIDFLTGPEEQRLDSYVRADWINAGYELDQFKKRKDIWDSMGAKYIMDYNIKEIIKTINNDNGLYTW